MPRKSRTKRTLKPAYVILVDGQTEQWYLNQLQQYEGIKAVKIKPELPKAKTWRELFDLAMQYATPGSGYDKVILILDLDVIIKEGNEQGNLRTIATDLKRKKEEFEHSKGILIVNTPCFEQWLLLHFSDSAAYHPQCASATQALKSHLPNYSKKSTYYIKHQGGIYAQLKPLLPKALTHSRKLGHFDPDRLQSAKAELFKLFDFLGIVPTETATKP